ncbi:glucosamine-6-phosphate isomerase [Pseudoruegeria sp. HB172150]|uniref:glucosamine-6-phosphate isomerase n=1 Tax=Pseudoruegeria sp. HB172150 TaxID=2721164 RepID=UPI00155559EA|nr:glucosamine-6-phosphate isomerase [Pseudoruegeria sp. HB172150]
MNEREEDDPYHGLDAETREALRLSRSDLTARLSGRAEIFADNSAMISAFADLILQDFRAALEAGREHVLMICPVGPVGQYDLLSARCRDEGISLNRLTLLIMDEYLTDAGAWIAADDPLSFRGHMARALSDLPEDLRPEVVVPDPADTTAVPALIESMGGVDVTYAGVGITGHLAFNDPIPGRDAPEFLASLPTRIVALTTETRLINSVTAARGNAERIPRLAVTVGMKEILSARRLRIFMNRDWQCAAIRRLAYGPVTGAFPASLVQNHPEWSLHLVDLVLDPAEPGLR